MSVVYDYNPPCRAQIRIYEKFYSISLQYNSDDLDIQNGLGLFMFSPCQNG